MVSPESTNSKNDDDVLKSVVLKLILLSVLFVIISHVLNIVQQQ